ncbi:PaaI family thioesterase [Sphingomonas arantia]|uniref:PaaI family thioesterase n=1 Tax=Sphingomonas arantia TaxID=1460676 RepID=A0ABW4TZ67_9SPHN
MADRADLVAGTAFDPARFARLLSGLGHNALLGLGYAAHGPDWMELHLPYADRLVGDPDTGVIASGPIVSLMDMATSMAVWTRVANFVPLATLDLRVDYLRPAVPGRTVTGHGECYRLTRRIAFVRGQAHDGDPADPIAHVAGTFMFTDAA